MLRNSLIAFAALLLLAACNGDAGMTDYPVLRPSPPFGGTIFIDPDIVTAADPTTFIGLESAGRATRTMYDRRTGWITLDPYLFVASFEGGSTIEMEVNPEFGSAESSQVEAEFYAEAVARLPVALRRDVETVWIHRGVEPFGGGNNNLLIHTGQAELYIADGILDETLVHEAAHTSLDADHANSAGWIAAQAADPTFISDYARDNPTREDIAESFLPYLAVRYRPDRVSPSLKAVIEATIPNRIKYFDSLNLAMYPIG